jgi:predicted Rossmann-fold nucleotide-binding protein
VHNKPIVLVNLHGHFDPVIRLIAHVVKDGFAASTANALYRVVKTPDQAIEAVEEQLTEAQSEAR